VPLVSPATVTVLYSQVLAELIVKLNGLLLVVLLKAPPKVPVKLERTQKDTVTVLAFAVPQPKSAML
jgi:hypothetical protein